MDVLPHFHVADDVRYVLLLAVLLILPRGLQRFRIPAAITSFFLGLAATHLDLLPGDTVVGEFATLGITAIFLFAGLEVDLHALRSDVRPIAQHLAIGGVVIAVVAVAACWTFSITTQAAVVVALALLTPSGGFILESLSVLGLFQDEQTTIRNKVIATELLALGLVLFALKSGDLGQLALSLAVVAGIVLFVPFFLRIVTSVVVPHAPRSEFAFLVLLAVACALVTKKLGVYYLVGAFVVGVTARRFRDRVPAMSSERIVHAVEALASLFAPFYFFHAGAALQSDDLSLAALGVGVVLLFVAGALRVWTMLEHSRWTSREGALAALRKALPMLPTLVFTLVLAEILRDRFEVPEYLVGGLIVYAVLNTLLPGLVVRSLPVPGDGSPDLPAWPEDHG